MHFVIDSVSFTLRWCFLGFLSILVQLFFWVISSDYRPPFLSSDPGMGSSCLFSTVPVPFSSGLLWLIFQFLNFFCINLFFAGLRHILFFLMMKF